MTVLAVEPGHGADDVRVGAKHDVHAEVGEVLRVLGLVVVRLHEVLGAPVHGHEHDVGLLARSRDVRRDAVLVDEVDGIAGQVGGLVAVDAVGVVQQRERDPVSLDRGDPARVCLGGGGAGEDDVLFLPQGAGVVVRAEVAPVVAVVGGGAHEVEAGGHEGVGHGVGRVEGRVARRADVVSAAVGLFLDVGEVGGLDVALDRLVDGGVVVDAVARRAGLCVGPGADAILGEVVADGYEVHAAGGGLGGRVSVVAGAGCGLGDA